MATQRDARLVCNPGLVCSAQVDSVSLGALPVLNLSNSGIALGGVKAQLFGASAFELTIFHRSRASESAFGADQPLRVRARLTRHDSDARRLCLQFEPRLRDEQVRALRAADHEAYASETVRWGADSFLDQLTAAGDFASDALDEKLTLSALRGMNRALAHADANSGALPADAPADLRAFWATTAAFPSWVDFERMQRGTLVLREYALPIGVVLFLKVLPTGYCAPALSRALAVSGDLKDRPVRRSLLVLNMILELCADNAFVRPGGTAMRAAQRLRLLHAGVRRIVRGADGKYTLHFGVPVSQEHMLATIVGFSYETLKGLRQFRVRLSSQQEEDFFYVWQVFGWMLGLHPEGQVESRRHLPQTFEQAEAFQIAYRRRHFRSAADNPHGVELTQALLLDLSRRIGLGLPLPLVRRMPYWLCAHFLSDDDQRRMRVADPRFPRIARASIGAFVAVLAFVRWLCDRFDAGRSAKRSVVMRMLSEIVHEEFDTEPQVLIPNDLRALRDLIEFDTLRRGDAERSPDLDQDGLQAR